MQVQAIPGEALDIGFGREAGDEAMTHSNRPRRLAHEADVVCGLKRVGRRKRDLDLSWPIFTLHQSWRHLLLAEGREPGGQKAIMLVEGSRAKERGKVGGLIGKRSLTRASQHKLVLGAHLRLQPMLGK